MSSISIIPIVVGGGVCTPSHVGDECLLALVWPTGWQGPRPSELWRAGLHLLCMLKAKSEGVAHMVHYQSNPLPYRGVGGVGGVSNSYRFLRINLEVKFNFANGFQ